MPSKRVIVIGTTADYIEILSRRFPTRVAFVTDYRERLKNRNTGFVPELELVADLTRTDQIATHLTRKLRDRDITPSGIACFDCESLLPASRIAASFNLPFAGPEAAALSRNKYLSKKVWKENGIPCPETALIHTDEDAVDFMDRVGGPVILKPLTGSGSELVFACAAENDCRQAFRIMKDRLRRHDNVRMYDPGGNGNPAENTRETFAIEEYVSGVEYSADLMIDGDRLDIIRIAAKLRASGQPTGTTLAYILPADISALLDAPSFALQLLAAARALGIDHSLVMVDFIIRDRRAYLLEMTPRPGGDCLPWLIEQSSHLDVFKAALDFAEGRQVEIPMKWKFLVGLRLFAHRAGIIENIDLSAFRADDRVCQCYLKVRPGHTVILPPDDYDSRILGHVIFRPSHRDRISEECEEMAMKLRIDIRKNPWAKTRIS